MATVKYFTNISPHYRAPLWSALLNSADWDIHFFYGDNSKAGIEEINFEEKEFVANRNKLHRLKNYWWNGDVLLWQGGMVIECCRDKFDHAVFLGEMSHLSTWIAAIICRIRGIKVTFWGHGLYGFEKGAKLILKKLFFRLAHTHLLYERRAKKIITQHGFNPNKLYVVFNSLNYNVHKRLNQELQGLAKDAVFPFFRDLSLPVVIFIGRLTKVKKLDILLSAVNQINAEIPRVNLVMMGDGPEREQLEDLGEAGVKERWLHFTGACYDEEVIGKHLSMSDLCVSPGNVGLTAIHSLSFGTPVGTHDNMFNQMPEAEVIQHGYNGFFFKENDVNDLKVKIEEWVNTMDRELTRKRSYEIIDEYYNPYYQLTVFNRLFSGEKPEL